VELVYGQVASSSRSESDSLPANSALQSIKILQEAIQTTEKWKWKNLPHQSATYYSLKQY